MIFCFQLYQTGTEQFNIKPSKGIAFLQEHDLLSKPLNPNEVALFLREDPKLDKKMIGEYISSKKNTAILEAFIRWGHCIIFLKCHILFDLCI